MDPKGIMLLKPGLKNLEMQQTLEEIWYHAEVDAKYVQLDCMVFYRFQTTFRPHLIFSWTALRISGIQLKSTMLANSCTYLNDKTLIVPWPLILYFMASDLEDPPT